MSKLELPAGQDNVIVRNQEVYGFLPKDVIDRMGDTSTQLATEDQTALGAINELKSNLTELPYYQDGDTFTVGLSYFTGMINSNGKSIGLSFSTPKIIPSGYTITVSGTINNLRTFGSSGAIVNGITLDTPTARGDNTIYQSIVFTQSLTAYAGACVVPSELVYTFHAPS